MNICIICFRFRSENLNKQPWRYILELAKGIREEHVGVKVISNGTKSESQVVDGVEVRYVRASDRTLHSSQETLSVLQQENPDVIIMLIGLLDLLKRKKRLGKPIIAIMTSPLYTVSQILRLGAGEFLSHSRVIYIHLLTAILPRLCLGRGAKFYDHFVVLSEANKTRLLRGGVSSQKVTVLRPGIHDSDLTLPSLSEVKRMKAEFSPDGSPIILYFGSPLTLRGTDTLLEAFAQVTPPSRLLILSRLDDQLAISEHQKLQRMIRDYGLTDRVIVKSSLLDRSELKTQVCAADVVCLPLSLSFLTCQLRFLRRWRLENL